MHKAGSMFEGRGCPFSCRSVHAGLSPAKPFVLRDDHGTALQRRLTDMETAHLIGYVHVRVFAP